MEQSSFPIKIPNKFNLQNFRTFQFLAEFLIFSKYGQQTPIFQQFLVGTEMIKFVLKTVEYYRTYRHPTDPSNILLEKYGQPHKEEKTEEKSEKHKSKVERIKASLDSIKSGKWSKMDFQPEMFEVFPNGKRIQMVTSTPIPRDLERKRLSVWQLLGEFLLMLRPVLAIIAIRVKGEDSYKPYFLSIIIELIVFWLQRKMTLLKPTQVMQFQSRQKDFLWRILFKRPFFKIFLELVKKVMGKFVGEHRWIYRLVVFILEVQSSITLTI